MGLSNNLSCEAGSLSYCRPTPTGVFNQRFEALFPHAGALGCVVCFAPRHLSGLSVCECGATECAPAPFVPHSASLGPATATRVLSAPVAISAPPTGLDECLFFIYLVSDFLAIRFSVSSGCARRRSVYTYTAILVLLPFHLNFNYVVLTCVFLFLSFFYFSFILPFSFYLFSFFKFSLRFQILIFKISPPFAWFLFLTLSIPSASIILKLLPIPLNIS